MDGWTRGTDGLGGGRKEKYVLLTIGYDHSIPYKTQVYGETAYGQRNLKRDSLKVLKNKCLCIKIYIIYSETQMLRGAYSLDKRPFKR